MIELILSVCSILHGAQCKEERLTFLDERLTPYACMMYGQLEISKWQAAHLNWQVTGWRCRTRRTDVQEAKI